MTVRDYLDKKSTIWESLEIALGVVGAFVMVAVFIAGLAFGVNSNAGDIAILKEDDKSIVKELHALALIVAHLEERTRTED